MRPNALLKRLAQNPLYEHNLQHPGELKMFCPKCGGLLRAKEGCKGEFMS